MLRESETFSGKSGEWGAHGLGLAATAPSSGVGSTPPPNSAFLGGSVSAHLR